MDAGETADPGPDQPVEAPSGEAEGEAKSEDAAVSEASHPSAEPKETAEAEVQTGEPEAEDQEKPDPDYEHCFLSAARKSKTDLYGILKGDPYMIEHANVMRFQIESADLLQTQILKGDMDDVKEVKTEAAKQIREKSRGSKVECGAAFLLRNVEYDMYLVIDVDSAAKGERKLTLSTHIVPEALFRIKGSALVSGLSTHMEYNLPGNLFASDGSSIHSSKSSDSFWTITVKDHPTTWTFHKYEDAAVSDSYVRYMTPVRLKLKNSNYFLSTEKLEVAYGTISENPTALTIDPDNIACYFLMIPADFKGGYVKWNQPFYLRHAVTANFLDYSSEKELGYNDVGMERFQIFVRTSKATSPYVRFNLPISLWTYRKDYKTDPIEKDKMKPLTVKEPSSISQALTVAATFESSYVTDDICGQIAVSESTGELFEIQPVAYEDTLAYRGLNIMLTVIAKIRQQFDSLASDDMTQFKQGKYNYSCVNLLESLSDLIGNLLDSVKQLQGEIKNASVAEVVAKQKIMMQANVPTELVSMLGKISDVMRAKWKADGRVKQDVEFEEGSEYLDSEMEESAGREDEDSPVEEENQSQGEEEAPEAEGSEAELSQGEDSVGQEPASPLGSGAGETEEQPQDDNYQEKATDFLNLLSEPSYQTFQRTLDFVLDCIKSFAPGCKKMLSAQKSLFDMFDLGRESVGRVLAEVFTYAFPVGINRSAYLSTISSHFSVLTKDNIDEQLIFIRMLNKLIQGDSLEGKAFAKYTFDEYISQVSVNEASFRMLERTGKFYVHFLECEDGEKFEGNNPGLKGHPKITEGDFTYYELAGMEAKYVTYVENFLYLLSAYKEPRVVDVLVEPLGITSGMLRHMITTLEVPVTLRIAAIYIFTSILTNQRDSQSTSLIIDLKSPYHPPESTSSPLDLVKNGAGSDIKEAVRLTLTLSQPTESFFPPKPSQTDSKLDKEAEEKAESQLNLEKVWFISALFGVSHALIQLGKVQDAYICEMMKVVSVGLNLIAPKGKNDPDKTPNYWFPVAAKAVIDKAGKNFEAKTAIEELFDLLLKNVNSAVDVAVKSHIFHYPEMIKQEYERYMRTGSAFDAKEIVEKVHKEVILPARGVFEDSQAFEEFVKRNKRQEPGLETPLLTDAQSDVVAYYGLEKCTLTSASNLWSIMTGLLVNSTSLGLKFDQLLVEGILRSLKTRKLVTEKILEFLFVEEDENLQELRKKCDFSSIFSLMTEITDIEMTGIREFISLLLDNPLVIGSKLLSKFEYRYMLQSYVNQNPANIELVCYLLDRVNNEEKKQEGNSEVRELCFTGRCAALRFLTNFISDNSACKQTLLKYLRPSHLTYLIPEVADLIRELFDWDFLSTETTEIVFKSLMTAFRTPGPPAYYALYYLKSILYDRSGNFKPSVQNLIIDILGEKFGELISKMQQTCLDLRNAEEPEEEGKEQGHETEPVEGEKPSEEAETSEKEDKEGENEEEKSGNEEEKSGNEGENSEKGDSKGEGSKQLEDTDYFYIESCLMLLGHCASGNDIIRSHIRALNLTYYTPEIFSVNRHRYGLISSILQVINAGYKDTEMNSDEAGYFEEGLGLALEVAEEVLGNEEGMLDVITSNYYAVIPRRGMVPLSSQFDGIRPEQVQALQQLAFLLHGSEKDVPSGIVVALPEAFSLLKKANRDTTSLTQRFLALLPRIDALFSKVDDEDQSFDLSSCKLRLKAAQMSDEKSMAVVQGSSRAVGQMAGLAGMLKTRPSFMNPLSSLYDSLRRHSLAGVLVEDSMASKLADMCKIGKVSLACKCVKKLMGRIPVNSFYTTAAKFMQSLPESTRVEVLKGFIRLDVITNTFIILFADRRIKSDIAILGFLNTVLEDQPAELVISIKDQLVKQLLDGDLLSTIVREFSDSIKIISASKEVNLPISSYMPLLARFDYKTYGQNSRRLDLLKHLKVLIGRYLELLQRFCDGCNLQMQRYMRGQGEEDGTNMVKLVTDYLCTILSMIDGELAASDLREYVVESLKALIEFATGPCIENQTQIGRYVPLYIALNKLFETPPEIYYSWEEVSEKKWSDDYTELRATGIKMLLVLLEGDPHPDVVKCMDTFLNKALLLDNIKQVYSVYVQKLTTPITTEDPCVAPILPLVKNALNEACFLITLLGKNDEQKLSDVTRDLEDLNAFKQFYMSYIGYVEIDKPVDDPNASSDANIREIYFVIPFKCKFLPYETAKSLIVDGNHESHQDLIEGLLKGVKGCKEEMEYHQAIARDPKSEYLLSQWLNLKMASLGLVFLSNLMLLWSSEPELYRTFVWDDWVSYIAVLLLGLAQIALYTVGTVFYVLEAKPTLLAEEEDEGISMEDLATQTDKDDQQQKYRSILKSESTEPSSTPTWLKLTLAVKLDIFYLLLSLLSIPFPMLFPLLLFQIFAYLPDLRTILQAITQNKVQLLYTGIFGLIILLCMTIICFVFYQGDFSIENNDMSCSGFFECYLSVINQGLRAGGGLGDALGAPAKDSSDFWPRMIFDFCFFICISVILLQIIFGIILDAFGDMRDQRGALMEDINSVCYVCGKPRSELELYGKGWTYHFQNEHSPYAYLSFLVYLLDMDTADCSGVEKFAKEKLLKVDTTFLPSTSKLLAKRKKD